MEAATNNNEEKTVRNSDVVQHWSFDQPAAAGNLITSGGDLFSYRLKIGYTTPNGTKVVLDYTAAGEYHSQTTSCHVGLAKRFADVIMHPLTHEVIEG